MKSRLLKHISHLKFLIEVHRDFYKPYKANKVIEVTAAKLSLAMLLSGKDELVAFG